MSARLIEESWLCHGLVREVTKIRNTFYFRRLWKPSFRVQDEIRGLFQLIPALRPSFISMIKPFIIQFGFLLSHLLALT